MGHYNRQQMNLGTTCADVEKEAVVQKERLVCGK